MSIITVRKSGYEVKGRPCFRHQARVSENCVHKVPSSALGMNNKFEISNKTEWQQKSEPGREVAPKGNCSSRPFDQKHWKCKSPARHAVSVSA